MYYLHFGTPIHMFSRIAGIVLRKMLPLSQDFMRKIMKIDYLQDRKTKTLGCLYIIDRK